MKPPAFWSSAARIFELSLGQMLWSRRTVFMLLVAGGPVVIAVAVRIVGSIAGPNLRVVSSAPGIFGMMVWLFYLRFTVPVLAVFYGTGLIADEVEDKTITYLFTRPIRRGAILVGKYLAYLACTILVVLPSIMAVYFLVVTGRGGGVAESYPAMVADLGLLSLGLAVYGAVFAWVGARFKRPLVTGLVFLFGWEPIVLVVPGYLKRLTVAHYLQALAPHTMPQDNVVTFLQGLFRDMPSLGGALGALGLIGAGFLYLAVRVVEGREYVLEQ